MSSLIELAGRYIFSGVPSNAAWDLIKIAWSKSQDKSWEELYIDSFKQSFSQARPILSKYADSSGEIDLDEQVLVNVLRRDLYVDPATLSFSTLNDEQFATQLSKAMAKHSVLIIGGHNLSSDDYTQLIYNLVHHARVHFTGTVLKNEGAFRQAMLDELQAVQARLYDTHDASVDTKALLNKTKIYLENQFGLALLRLDEIGADVKDIKRILNAPTQSQNVEIKAAPKQHKIMISSTARDLPEHREKVMHACMRLGMFHPEMMEYLTATTANAMQVSLTMVDKADIYIGVFAYRYGYIPKEKNPQEISITEMEYNRAVERRIPRLIFLMSDQHAIKPTDVETGEGAKKLEKLKERLKTEQVVGFFSSQDDLLGQVIQALVAFREPNLTTFHYISDIPKPPETYIAHPYTLLQTRRLVGRQAEINLLTDWVSKSDSDVYQTHILNIIAIGGMGKSALTWKWFNEVLPQEMRPLAGQMWWSFYESDASFDNFVTRALAYVSRQSGEAIQGIPAPEREEQLLVALDHEPFLIVLDGLERVLVAYDRLDAMRLKDQDINTYKSLRKSTDPRVGRFLKRLTQLKKSRVLVSSRLYPAELETKGGDPLPGSFKYSISGLADEDAIEVWRSFGVTGSRSELLGIFNAIDKHPLLIQALAGEVKRYRPAPGIFEKWREAHSLFNLSNYPEIKDAMAHVLEFSLHGLDENSRKVLHNIAAFRMPASYETINALHVGKDKLCTDEHELDAILTDLEDRGLLGWDRRANRYDLHPLVRSVVWNELSADKKKNVYTTLHSYFDPLSNNYALDVKNLDDLAPTIELYNTLIGLGLYNEAWDVYQSKLGKHLFFALSAGNQIVRLLEMLFPQGLDHMPRVTPKRQKADVLVKLADSMRTSGQPHRTISLYSQSNDLYRQDNNIIKLSDGLGSQALAMYCSGMLYKSENTARQALFVTNGQGILEEDARNLVILGLILVARGNYHDGVISALRGKKIFESLSEEHLLGATLADLAVFSIWSKDWLRAQRFAEESLRLAVGWGCKPCTIKAKGLLGTAFLETKGEYIANIQLSEALSDARSTNLVENELSILLALSELRRRQKDFTTAHNILKDIWESVERESYPLYYADAYNVLAQIERDKSNFNAAVDAATSAYRLAWCDGEPFAYHWGLNRARKLLFEFGIPEPQMPSFNERKFTSMPKLEINPNDKFHVNFEKDFNIDNILKK